MVSVRTYRLATFALACSLLLVAAFRVYATWTHPFWQALGPSDLVHYLLATQRWLDTGTPYVASEIAGHFNYGELTFLHPPISLLFFAPFLVLPLPLFWIIPLAIFGYLIAWERPARWTWPLMALALAVYPIGSVLWSGNTDIWMWAFFAAGLRWGWPVALMALKPSIAIAGLIGIRHRSSWVGWGLVALVALPFGSLWIDWIHVVFNSPGTFLYSASNVVMFAIPLVARLGSTRSPVGESRSIRMRLAPRSSWSFPAVPIPWPRLIGRRRLVAVELEPSASRRADRR
jgi:hypothetical protein